LFLLALALLPAALAGCRQSTSTVHGTVMYEGAAISRGQITFTPASGHGVARSGPISSGKYSVNDVPPGRKTVQIIGVKQIHFAKTQGEDAKRGPSAAAETADDVPADAEGNGQTVETTPGEQELDFNLKRPSVVVSH
jgi:hypothetical protein